MADVKNILDEEHEELKEMLVEAAHKNTEAGRIFSEVFRIFRHHLDKENETVVPLLAYLKDRLGDFMVKDKEALNLARAKFVETYPEMMREHEEMAKLIRSSQDLLKNNTDRFSADLAEHILHHVELEEELLYPAAFASGDLVWHELEMLGDKKKR